MAILDFQNPPVVTFGILGNIVSIGVYLAPLPTFIQICREKSVLGFQALPYLVALFSSMLWLYYAFLKVDAVLLITINSFGCLVETIYIMIYLIYASKNAKKDTAKLFVGMNGLLFFAILLLTHFLFDGRIRVQVVGWVCVAVSVSVFAAPLSIVVVRTRSVKFMPFTLSVFLTLSAVMWFFYGLFEMDPCIWIPNVAGFILGLLQMSLYAVYRNAREILKEDEKLPAEHIIVIMGTPEVHPFHDAEKAKSENDVVKNHEKENEQSDDSDDDNNNPEKIVASPHKLPNRATVQLDWVTHDAEKTESENDWVKNHERDNEKPADDNDNNDDNNNNQDKIVALPRELANRATVQLDSPVLVVCRA